MKPCANCGECCLAITCDLGQAIFLVSEDAVCPAIEKDGEFYYCGLISNTANYVKHLAGREEWKTIFLRDVFKELVGIGIGCTNGDKTGEDHKCDLSFPEILMNVANETTEREG